ncbi:MAG: SIMPL domain-containing protein [Lewinellaceae bacterium]|nr:SIMPL domain-containing protein [Lewinellaceae bacterium]
MAVYSNSEVVLKVSDVEALLSFIAQIRENRQYSGSLIRAEYSGREKAMQSLRREALGDAKSKASEMARALGASISLPWLSWNCLLPASLLRLILQPAGIMGRMSPYCPSLPGKIKTASYQRTMGLP